MGLIVGIVAGVIGLFVIVGAVILIRRKRQQKTSKGQDGVTLLRSETITNRFVDDSVFGKITEVLLRCMLI